MRLFELLMACSVLLATISTTEPLQAQSLATDSYIMLADCPCKNKNKTKAVPPVGKADASILLTDCPCKNKNKAKLVPPVEKGAGSILLAGCPCKDKNKPRPVPPVGKENEVSFLDASCGCKNNRTPKSKGSSDNEVAIVLAGCGCQKEQVRAEKNPMPAEKESKLYSQMAKIADKNRKLAGGKRAPAHPSKMHVEARSYGYYGKATSFPPVTYFIKEKDTDQDGKLITMLDGSVWSIRDSDREQVQAWPINAEFAIQPNTLTIWHKLTWTTPDYKYRLVNMKTNKSVAANMSLGPFKYNPNTRKIDRIDFNTGDVFLNNGTRWKVDSSRTCLEILREWKRDQAVFCGINDTWFSLGSPFILINVEKDTWLPATRY